MVKRTYAPRSTQSKAKRRKTIPVIPKSLYGNSTYSTFKYVSSGSLNPASGGVPATVVFRANGMYDPEVAVGGHQPRGFDEMMALFRDYTVVKSTIKITFVAGGSTSVPGVVGVMLQDDATPEGDMVQAMEGRTNDYKMYGAGGDGYKTLKIGFEGKSFFAANWPDQAYSGTNAADPATQAYYVLFAQPPTAIDGGIVDYVAEITYHCKLDRPNNVAAS